MRTDAQVLVASIDEALAELTPPGRIGVGIGKAWLLLDKHGLTEGAIKTGDYQEYAPLAKDIARLVDETQAIVLMKVRADLLGESKEGIDNWKHPDLEL